jgi:lipopolysaccharide/colanic/teichoic acid biosynthesis glycosyltransferase
MTNPTREAVLSAADDHALATRSLRATDRGFDLPTRSRLERGFDLVMVALLLPLLLIPATLVAVAVFLDSPGAVIYRTRRVGLGGRRFSMLKFRTMRAGATGPSLTAAEDERITPIGRFLRKSRLDELPQLWNVLRGEMRLVGPRPELEEFVAMYPREYDEILSVPPGVAGRTQLQFALVETAALHGSDDANGHYARELMPRKVALDLDYVRTRTTLGDLRILATTLLLPLEALVGRLARAWSRHAIGMRIALALTGSAAVGLLLVFLLASGPAR